MPNRLRNIDLTIRRHPITIFQLAVFLIHHETWLAWVLLFGAPFADAQFRNLEAVEDWVSEVWKVVRFVHTYAECTYQRFGLSEVADPDTIAQFQNRVVSRNWKWRKWEERFRSLFWARPIEMMIIDRTRLYTVGRGRSKARPGPSSFGTDIGGFIFVSEPPVHIKGVYRFYLLHELGHLSPFSKYMWRRSRTGSAPFFAFYFWALPQLMLPTQGFWTFAVLLFAWEAFTFIRDTAWFVNRQFGVIFDEIEADRFAFMTLACNPRELLEVAIFFEKWSIPLDPTIPDDDGLQKMNAARRDVLADNFAEARKRRGKVRGYLGLPQPSQTERQVWMCFAIVLGFVPLANPANCNSAAAAGLLCLVAFLLFVFMYSRARALEEMLENVLSGNASVPADLIASWPVEPRWQGLLRRLLGYEDAPLEKGVKRRFSDSAIGLAVLMFGSLLCVYLNSTPSQTWCMR